MSVILAVANFAKTRVMRKQAVTIACHVNRGSFSMLFIATVLEFVPVLIFKKTLCQEKVKLAALEEIKGFTATLPLKIGLKSLNGA